MLYFVTPGENQFPGIMHLFEETQAVVGGELIYLSDLQKANEEDTVIFGAWSPQYAMAIRRNCKAKKKYLHWASPLLQAELAGVEIGYLNMIMTLLKQEVLDGIWVLDKGVYDAYKDIGNVFYAPAPFNADSLSGYRKGVEEREDVSFFTIFHNKQKNVLCQLASAKQAQKENPFTLYVNGLTPVQTAFVDMIKLKYCELHFLPQKDYFEWLSLSKLGLQVSASEAFSYVTSEILSLGVPVLMSPVVAHNMGMENNTRLIVNDISSVEEIKEGILDILGADEDEYMFMCRSCRTAIEHTAIRNNREIADMFSTKIMGEK
jgi:hypothetical protein